MRAKALIALSVIALALLVCLAVAVVGHNSDAAPDYPLPAGMDAISGIIFEKGSFTRTSLDDHGNVWVVDTGDNQLCRINWKPALIKAPGIRQLLAVDEYYRESGAVRERLTPGDLLVRTRVNGGFTYNPLYGATPLRGYAVSLQGFGKIYDVGTMTNRELLEYMQKNVEITRNPVRYIGGWVDGDRLYLDNSVVLQDEREALSVGRVNGQSSIFDLGTNETIYLKGPDGRWLIDASGNWLPVTEDRQMPDMIHELPRATA